MCRGVEGGGVGERVRSVVRGGVQVDGVSPSFPDPVDRYGLDDVTSATGTADEGRRRSKDGSGSKGGRRGREE